MYKNILKNRTIKFSAVFVLLLGISISCDTVFDPNPPNQNEPPETTIANNPVEGDTLFALVTLHWDGGDEDGFVENYEYRYTTIDPETGDSTVTEWKTTEETSLTITFSSPNPINKQRFQVRSVDDKGMPDKKPAEKVFYTEQTSPPKVEIATPQSEEMHYYLNETTDWYSGIHLTFSGSDEDGQIVEYGWAVDDNEFTWTADTSVFIGPQNFGSSGEHIIRLTAKDDTELESVNPDTVTVELIEPSFSKDVLIVDETRDSELPGNVTDTEVDSFYTAVFGSENEWDYFEKGMPPKDVISQYNLVIWHADNNWRNAGDAHNLVDHTDEVSSYMNVGGDFIMSGWRVLKSFVPEANFPRTFEPGSFVNDYLHIQTANETPNLPGDFAGANGSSSGFRDVSVDSSKVSGFPYSGYLTQVNLITDRAGFTDNIYTYRPQPGQDAMSEFRGETVGVRYYGTSFNAVVLGFPIYLLEDEDAHILAEDVLTSMGYDSPN